MLDAIKMGRWLGINEQLNRAKSEVGAVVHRWDVPQGQRKPGQDPSDKEVYIQTKKGWAVLAHDLRDVNGRYYRTAPDPVSGRQGRVAGRVLQEDMLLGAWSPAIPLLFGLLSILGVFTTIFAGTWLTFPLMLAMLPVAVLISTATERFTWGATAVGLSVVLPLIAGSKMADSAMSAIGGLGGGSGGLSGLMPFGILVGLAVLFGGLRGARVALGVIVGLALILLIASHTPGFFRPIVLAIPGALMPAIWTIYEDMRRAKRLAKQGQSSFESSELPLSHVEGRLEQAQRASLDTSPLITVGHATGRFTGVGDGWAPDMGLPVCQSVNDLGTHLLVLGSTGRGKTSSIIRPYVAAWVRAGGNGCLIMDGKGDLPAEFAGMKDYLLIDPAVNVVGLYQGMSASEVSRTLREVNVTDSAQGDSRMWNDLAFDMCRHSAVVLEALVELLDMEVAADKKAGLPEVPRKNRPWFWTLHNHQRLAVMGLAGADAIADVAEGNGKGMAEAPSLQTYLDMLLANHPEGKTGLLAEARHYFLSELPAMPPNVRGSIFTTFSSWLTPITGHKELLAWAQAETGVCVEDCLHGKKVGISLPESRYGRSGAIATAFLKNRVFNQVRQRAGKKWRELDPTAKPVLMVMDECQLLLSDADQEISPIGRSLGCFFLCCSQTIEGVRQVSKNLNKTEAFLDSFQSLILLASSHETVEWVSKRLGTVWRHSTGGITAGVDFVDGALKSLESPLFDSTHPSRRWMQTLLRRGAGGFADVAPMIQDRTIEVDLAFPLSVAIPIWEEKPLLSRATFSGLTFKQGVALVSLMRSGSPRRDFINLDQIMDVLPDDLMDKDWLAGRAMQAAQDSAKSDQVKVSNAA